MKKILPLVFVSFLSMASYTAMAAQAEGYTPNTVAAQTNDSLSIKHQSGTANVKKQPSRVVLFDFGIYDSMDKLGLAKNVIALPTNNTPAYLKDKLPQGIENAGGMKEPDLAKIAALKPDLIVITGRQGKSFDALSKIAPTVNLGTDSKNYLSSVEANIKLIGELYGDEKAVNSQLAELNKTIEAAQQKADKSDAKALVLMHNAGKIFPNNQSVVYDIVKVKQAKLPVQDVEDKAKRPSVTGEMIAQANPDIIFIIDRSAAIGVEPLNKAQFEDASVKTTNAYKNGKIIILQPDLWYLSGGGLESLSAQINEVQSAL